jgi:peroxiredoxin
VIVFAGIIIVVILVAWYAFSQPINPPGGVGVVAPDFQLPEVTAQGLTDRTVQLSSFRGKVVVVEFMVSWCHVCQEMASSLTYLNEKYRAQDVVFLSVAGTQSGATAESTAEFIREHGTTWTYVLDTTDGNSVFTSYGVEATPSFFVIDRSGRILSNFRGFVATEAFSAAIDAALSG